MLTRVISLANPHEGFGVVGSREGRCVGPLEVDGRSEAEDVVAVAAVELDVADVKRRTVAPVRSHHGYLF